MGAALGMGCQERGRRSTRIETAWPMAIVVPGALECPWPWPFGVGRTSRLAHLIILALWPCERSFSG